jgi:hypothetical protein
MIFKPGVSIVKAKVKLFHYWLSLVLGAPGASSCQDFHLAHGGKVVNPTYLLSFSPRATL